mmetsp:Transcript_3081/g.4459  ORF Transcript_3081/g.4459 Transcript_3081/m.4459 type:complete len:457 (+) Transcript_3081:310-1680(+)
MITFGDLKQTIEHHLCSKLGIILPINFKVKQILTSCFFYKVVLRDNYNKILNVGIFNKPLEIEFNLEQFRTKGISLLSLIIKKPQKMIPFLEMILIEYIFQNYHLLINDLKIHFQSRYYSILTIHNIPSILNKLVLIKVRLLEISKMYYFFDEKHVIQQRCGNEIKIPSILKFYEIFYDHFEAVFNYAKIKSFCKAKTQLLNKTTSNYCRNLLPIYFYSFIKDRLESCVAVTGILKNISTSKYTKNNLNVFTIVVVSLSYRSLTKAYNSLNSVYFFKLNRFFIYISSIKRIYFFLLNCMIPAIEGFFTFKKGLLTLMFDDINTKRNTFLSNILPNPKIHILILSHLDILKFQLEKFIESMLSDFVKFKNKDSFFDQIYNTRFVHNTNTLHNLNSIFGKFNKQLIYIADIELYDYYTRNVVNEIMTHSIFFVSYKTQYLEFCIESNFLSWYSLTEKM